MAVSEKFHGEYISIYADVCPVFGNEDQPWDLKRYHEVPRGTLFSCHDSAIPGSAERIGDVMEEAGKARPSI